MNANITTQIFHKMKYDLQGHTKSHIAVLSLKIYVFLDILFV